MITLDSKTYYTTFGDYEEGPLVSRTVRTGVTGATLVAEAPAAPKVWALTLTVPQVASGSEGAKADLEATLAKLTPPSNVLSYTSEQGSVYNVIISQVGKFKPLMPVLSHAENKWLITLELQQKI